MTQRNTITSRLKLVGALAIACGGIAAVGCSSSGDDTAAAGANSGGNAGSGISGGTHTGGGAGTGTGTGGTNGGTAGKANGGGPNNSAGAAGEAEAGTGTGGASELATFSVKQTNLDSDQDGAAQKDGHLLNAWGIAINPTAQLFWVASNHDGSVPVYDATGAIKSLDPKVAPLTGTDPGSPTGQVFNASTNFKGDKFIVDTEDGQILGWPGTGDFVQRQKKDGAIYKGLALVGADAAQMLVATDFHDGTVDLYDVTYENSAVQGAFVDSTIPDGFAPFNVMPIGKSVYVTYAKQDTDKEDDEAGLGNGYVSEFKTDGTYVRTLISGGALNSPWAVAMAPSNFGDLAGMLLVGNFGDGMIHAYDPTTGDLVGQLTTATGVPLLIPGLWDLKVGPTGTTDLSKTLFFSAGPGGEAHGIFGKLEAAP